ncbi:MAG TPA: GNAT family N-acetyltransferase, partial [Casimicrobiaceae bacterium]|nr:GNAT family N-acetyltransferase [Casimicrobiaceae bacterium]
LTVSNDAAAPLHEVRAMSCFARLASGQVVGGALGRRWGSCCEIQQVWVDSAFRRNGVGSKLVRAFEAEARSHGCVSFYLETFSFQAPHFYRALGYEVAYEHNIYPHGIVRYLMVKHAKDTTVT